MTTKKTRDHDNDLQDQAAPEVPQPKTFLDRMHEEHAQLKDRYEKLSAFIGTPTFNALDLEERDRLSGQRTAMGHYLEILTARIEYQIRKGAEA